jgi:DNA invertase Pin-like site-specific DNA recombinase
MQAFYGYIRVSTVRQGEHGVSLQEQREAIERFATRKGLQILKWFEEQQTAAKQGRPVFNQMLKLLRKGRASGVIIHKIDRSARNLKDWAEIGELIDSGIAVRFTDDSLDLNSTSGRLSADIQAVVAAHYIRNLREETLKGFYGRLKQGIYPMPALLGYLDGGAGKTKILDPVRAPLMKLAFQLYASGNYSLEALSDKLFALGLRTKSDKQVADSVLSRLLKNPFYMGVIKIRKTGESFLGAHEPLVSKALFDSVQEILEGKHVSGPHKHQHLFRRFIRCQYCDHSLSPERQKGHVYYRCHTNLCPTTTVREEIIDAAIREKLHALELHDSETRYLQRKFRRLEQTWDQDRQKMIAALELQIAKSKERLEKLTDAYLEGVLDKVSLHERQTTLIMERRELEDKLTAAKQKEFSVPKQLQEFFELAKAASLLYETAPFERKRRLLEKLTSNRTLSFKKVEITLAFPFSEIAKRFENKGGGPSRSTLRTWDELLTKVLEFLRSGGQID